MVLVFMALIMTRRLTPMVALIIVPTVFGLFAGGGLGLGDMILDAIGSRSASTAALLMFAIMYSRHHDRRRPVLIRSSGAITRLLGDDPAKVALGTAVLAGAVSLDGDGSTTFIITTSAMLPIYLRLGMSPVVLTCVAGLMNGTPNIVPWGGPTARAATALGLQPTDIFVPMLPSLAAGIVISLASFAWFLGLSERKRIGSIDESRPRRRGVPRRIPHLPQRRPEAGRPRDAAHRQHRDAGRRPGQPAPPPRRSSTAKTPRWPTRCSDPNRATLRPKLIWFNLALTLAVMVLLVLDAFPAYVFMVGAAIAPFVNFPKLKSQADEIVAHAPSIVGVVSMVPRGRVLVGVLNGTGMVDAMATGSPP